MPDPESESAAETASAQAEARAIRRRWITLGEVLAVAAVLISGLTLWNSWRERAHEETRETAEERKKVSEAASIALGGAAEGDGRRLAITSLRGDQPIQGQTIRFPRAIGVGAVETTGDARIEAEWIERGLMKALDTAKVDRKSKGDRRLPVLIVTRFWSDGAVRQAIGFYDVGYAISGGGMLDDRDLRLKGLSYVGAAKAEGAAERLDALWKARIAK